jgi:hypothetical protein
MNTPANQSIDKQILETLKKHADYISWVNLGGTRIGMSTHKTKQSIKSLLREVELEARIDELKHQHKWIIQCDDNDIAYNLEKRIQELEKELKKGSK